MSVLIQELYHVISYEVDVQVTIDDATRYGGWSSERENGVFQAASTEACDVRVGRFSKNRGNEFRQSIGSKRRSSCKSIELVVEIDDVLLILELDVHVFSHPHVLVV